LTSVTTGGLVDLSPRRPEGVSPIRLATYTRISTDEDHQPYSLDAQAERLGAYVKSQDGWELVRRFSDQASGATTERPELRRTLVETRAGRFDLLLVYRVDRFSQVGAGPDPAVGGPRRGRCRVQVGDRAVRHDHACWADDGADARGVCRVRTGHDRRPVIAGMERKAARGGWCGGSRPFGYDVDPSTGHLVAPDEAPLVPVMFDRYAPRPD
jgi:site-specific DNA recombinase